MLPFLLLSALVLSGLLLSDLVGGLRRSEVTSRTQWERAMAALSTPTARDALSSDGRAAAAERYDLAA